MIYNRYQPETPTKKLLKKTEHIYKTILNCSIHELDKSVNFHLKEGWRLVGHQHAVKAGGVVYLQPMEKIETKYELPIGPE